MIGSQTEASRGTSSVVPNGRIEHHGVKGSVLVVENERFLRVSLGQLLDEHGYEVSFADDGRDALKRLRSETSPNLIILDLKMPVMDGWEFRSIQRDHPKLGLIPVLVISADGSPQAAAISADGYLRKPFDSEEAIAAVERVLSESERRRAARHDETERLAALGRVAANVGHEINNPLTFVKLNLEHSLAELRTSLGLVDAVAERRPPDVELEELKAHILSVTDMLQQCEAGSERIRGTVTNLQRLSEAPVGHRGRVDIRTLIEEAASIASNQIRHRARLTKNLGQDVPVVGDRVALGQVFRNLLVNAAESISEGHAERNEIRVTTRVDVGANGAELVVEIRDSGAGIAPELVSRVFEPYFTTKPLGEGTGLGLSISRQTIKDHGGRLTVESELGVGTVFRVVLPVLPVAGSTAPLDSAALPISAAPPRRTRVLVIDDEPFIGRVIRGALKSEHDVVTVQRASEALARLEQGETFDLVLCDVVMPDLSGPEFYAKVAARWPQLAARLVFMTGGAFTPGTVAFMKNVPTAVLSKPFALDDLRRLVREGVRDTTNRGDAGQA
jgi:signal transduction histidine kinase